MADNTYFMDWLNKQHPDLFEMFNTDGVFIEKVNNQFVLHVIVIEEEIPLDKLNKLQGAWNDYILLENLGAEAHPLLVTQNKLASARGLAGFSQALPYKRMKGRPRG